MSNVCEYMYLWRVKRSVSDVNFSTDTTNLLPQCKKLKSHEKKMKVISYFPNLMTAHICWPGSWTQESLHGLSRCCWPPLSPGPEWTDVSVHLAWMSETELFLGHLLSPAQSNCENTSNDLGYCSPRVSCCPVLEVNTLSKGCLRVRYYHLHSSIT